MKEIECFKVCNAYKIFDKNAEKSIENVEGIAVENEQKKSANFREIFEHKAQEEILFSKQLKEDFKIIDSYKGCPNLEKIQDENKLLSAEFLVLKDQVLSEMSKLETKSSNYEKDMKKNFFEFYKTVIKYHTRSSDILMVKEYLSSIQWFAFNLNGLNTKWKFKKVKDEISLLDEKSKDLVETLEFLNEQSAIIVIPDEFMNKKFEKQKQLKIKLLEEYNANLKSDIHFL
ncbi:MAG: hypothetical protein H0U27_10675 [Nitrosopumilus sp.]|nr:hypothetical protein [Nitrosopumilus sp.]